MSVSLAASRAGVGRWVGALMPDRHRLPIRLVRLFVGLFGFGVSLAMMVRARLGLSAWDVLHQGLAQRLGVPMGMVTIAVSLLVLLAWLPLRQRPGLGTIANAVLVGVVLDLTLSVVGQPQSLLVRWLLLIGGILLNAVATGMYVGAGLGPGARDGLMTGLAQRGWSIRRARTVIELTVLALGFLLGGTVGVGTILFAVAIGPLTHFFLPRLSFRGTVRKETSR